jgi:hypothetical protein
MIATMCLLYDTPTYLKCLYKLTGVAQFSYNSQSNFPDFLQRLWCFPFYLYLGYTCLDYNFSYYYLENMLHYINAISNITNIICLSLCVFIFFKRTSNLKILLLNIDNIKFDCVKRCEGHYNWQRPLLLGLLFLNFAFIPFLKTPKKLLIYIYDLPMVLICFDNLFMNDVMSTVFEKFELINRQLHRQVNSVNFCEIFPLTKIEKIKILEDDEITFNVHHVQKLSHMHYDLVHLAIDICKNFEISILAMLVLGFQKIIATVYFIVYTTYNSKNVTVISYCTNAVYAVYHFCWLFVLIEVLSRVQNEANKTATFVHDIWNKYAVNGKIDKRVRHFQLISVRLLNTKLRLSARDFFNLDWTFYHMVLYN